MILLLWDKIKDWVIGIGALVLAVGAAWIAGKRGGSKEAEATATARDAVIEANTKAATAEQKSTNAEIRHDVETSVATQPVTDVEPNPSAKQLQDDWAR